eukprot:3106180-Pleurochrysis_carterae.AAC.1
MTEEFTFERGQTQIDNILVPVELLHTLKEAHTSTGVREKDHRMFMASLAMGNTGQRRGEEAHEEVYRRVPRDTLDQL